MYNKMAIRENGRRKCARNVSSTTAVLLGAVPDGGD